MILRARVGSIFCLQVQIHFDKEWAIMKYKIIRFDFLTSLIVTKHVFSGELTDFSLPVCYSGLRSEVPTGVRETGRPWNLIFRAGNSPCSLFLDLDFHFGFKLFLWDLFTFILCLSVLHTCASVHHVHPGPPEARKGHQISWNWSYSFELPRGCWESNPGLLEEQPALLNWRLSRLSLCKHLLHICLPTLWIFWIQGWGPSLPSSGTALGGHIVLIWTPGGS